MAVHHLKEENDDGTALVVLSFAFRVFFLLGALFAALLIPLWLCIFFLGRPSISPMPILIWHSHELVFGFVAAAIAGFMLTAICTWTGCRPLAGSRLAGIVLVWLAGRIAFLFPGAFGLPLTAALDLLFFAVLFVYVLAIIVKHRNWRNLAMPGLLALLFTANAVMHAGVIGDDLLLANRGRLLSLEIVMLMIAFVGGRIIPAFSANWLFTQGIPRENVKTHKALDLACLGALVLVLPVDFFLADSVFASPMALLAGVLLLARLVGWRGWLCRGEPLLWVLHVAYLWLVLALLLKGLVPYIAAVTPSVWSHVLGVGAIGTIILGVMTRVSLGHTGRPLHLPAWSVASYWLISLAAVCRLIYGLGLHPSRHALTAAGIAWSAAFIIFLLTYWNILTTRRVEPSR